MATIEELRIRFEALRKAREELLAKKVAAESRQQMATENYEKLLQELNEKFGIKTLEQAKKLYEEKRQIFEEALEKCGQLLNQVNMDDAE